MARRARSGTEPATAKSPLRLRMALAVFGLAVCLVALGWGLQRRGDGPGQAPEVIAVLAAVGAAAAVLDLIVLAVRWRSRRRTSDRLDTARPRS